MRRATTKESNEQSLTIAQVYFGQLRMARRSINIKGGRKRHLVLLGLADR